MSIKDTCPDAGLPRKSCSSVNAILSALSPSHNVSLIGNCIDSHEFTWNTKLLIRKDIRFTSEPKNTLTCSPQLNNVEEQEGGWGWIQIIIPRYEFEVVGARVSQRVIFFKVSQLLCNHRIAAINKHKLALLYYCLMNFFLNFCTSH